MTIYNANVSNIRRGVVDAVSPEDCEPYLNTQVQPIAWYAEVAGGPFALRVHDAVMAADIDLDLNALVDSLAPCHTDVYSSLADVVLPAAVPTLSTPWIDVRLYRYLGWFVRNVGAVNNITSVISTYAFDALGVINFGNGVVTAITPGASLYGGGDAVVNSQWRFAGVASFNYLSFFLTSTLGTSARVYVVGVK